MTKVSSAVASKPITKPAILPDHQATQVANAATFGIPLSETQSAVRESIVAYRTESKKQIAALDSTASLQRLRSKHDAATARMEKLRSFVNTATDAMTSALKVGDDEGYESARSTLERSEAGVISCEKEINTLEGVIGGVSDTLAKQTDEINGQCQQNAVDKAMADRDMAIGQFAKILSCDAGDLHEAAKSYARAGLFLNLHDVRQRGSHSDSLRLLDNAIHRREVAEQERSQPPLNTPEEIQQAQERLKVAQVEQRQERIEKKRQEREAEAHSRDNDLVIL